MSSDGLSARERRKLEREQQAQGADNAEPENTEPENAGGSRRARRAARAGGGGEGDAASPVTSTANSEASSDQAAPTSSRAARRRAAAASDATESTTAASDAAEPAATTSRASRRRAAAAAEGDDAKGEAEPAPVPKSARERARMKKMAGEDKSPEKREGGDSGGSSGGGTGTKQLSAIERARQARARRKSAGSDAAPEDEAAQDDDADGAGAATGARRNRRRRPDEGEAAEEGAAAGGADKGKRGSIRERLGMKPLAVKTGAKTAGELVEPLGERNSGGVPAAASGESSPSGESAASGQGGAAAGALRRQSTLGGMFKASSFARRLSARFGGRHEEEELPAWTGQADLFEDGARAVEQLAQQLTCVTIHRTDELPHDWRIAHPLCSVSVVNGHTGRLVHKSNAAIDATTPNERRGADGRPLETILPIMTKPFALRGASTRLPAWEEDLIFQESFAHLLHPRVFLMFELLDFAPDAPTSDAGLRPFAWGFLKLVSGSMTNPSHVNVLRPMPLQLQLFRWQAGVRPASASQPAVWAQYLAAGRTRYSSTLFATVRPLAPPERVSVKFPHRPMAVHHVEEGRIPYERLVQETSRSRSAGAMGAWGDALAGLSVDGGPSSAGPGVSVGDGASPWLAMTSRGAAPCQLPNAPLHTLAAGARGATAIAISPDGGLVAIALAEEGYSMLAFCDIFSGRRRETIHAHVRTIHELCWLPDGQRLASVSADGTCKIWRPRRNHELASDADEDDDEPSATLAHPSYVYCVCAQPKPLHAAPRGSAASSAAGAAGGNGGAPQLLITGANDNALRLWDVGGDKADLLATATGHKGRINSVAWPMEASLFSADGAGVIKSWEVSATGGPGGGPELKQVTSIEKKELKDVPINSVTPHPTRRTRLLVQTRRSQLMCLDHRMQHFSTRYVGHRCEAYHIRAAYSPDGRFVVAGSEDGRFFAWAEETGDMLLDGLQVGFSGPLLQISWSANQHILAMCGYGPDNPALLYFYDKDVAADNPLLAAAAAAAANTASQPPPLGGSADGGLPLAGTGGAAAALDATARAERRQGRAAARHERRGNLSTSLNAAAGGGSLGDAAVEGTLRAGLSAGAAALGGARRVATGLQQELAGALNSAATPDRKAMAAEARARQGAS